MNATKSFFCQHELECLGCWVTRDHIKPLPKKVIAILNIDTPKNEKEPRSFIGLVNCCHNSWIRRLDLLAPLSDLVGKNSKWNWSECEDKAFATVKQVIAREVPLAHPNFQLPFEIHTDASDHCASIA